jgi:hypothetical protein
MKLWEQGSLMKIILVILITVMNVVGVTATMKMRDSDTQSDYDDKQNDNLDENSYVNRYKNLNISWETDDFIPTVHQFCDTDSGVRSNSFDDSSKPV